MKISWQQKLKWFWEGFVGDPRRWTYLIFMVTSGILIGLLPQPWRTIWIWLIASVMVILSGIGVWFNLGGSFRLRERGLHHRSWLVKISRVSAQGWLFPAVSPVRYGYAFCVWSQSINAPWEKGVRFVRRYPYSPTREKELGQVFVTKCDGTVDPIFCVIPVPCQIREAEAEAERDAMVYVMSGSGEPWM